MNYLLSFLSIFLILSCAAPIQNELSSDRKASYNNAPEALQIWVDARAGSGDPVHWVADGYVYEYPSGKKVFGIKGFDSSISIWPDNETDPIIHLTRKTFAYTDVETGEVITEYNGEKVEPIAYPYQMISYRLEDDKIFGDVEQGVGDRIRKIPAKDGIPFRKLGDSYIYNAQVYLDFPLPSGDQYQAWENYDFFIHPEGTVEEPYQMTWQRFGSLPKWAGGTPAIVRLHSWRVESHDEFDPQLLSWAKSAKAGWLTPPLSMEEIRGIQKGEVQLPGWSQ